MGRWLLAVLFIASLSSCTPPPHDRSTSPPTPDPVRIPRAETGEIALFAREDNTFLTYNLATGEPGTSRATDTDFFGYEFTSLHPIYTGGDSYRGGFVAVERQGRNFVELARTPPGVDLLPLATNGTRTFFVRSATKSVPGEKPEIVELKGGQLHRLQGNFGQVYSGALVGDELFLSVFHPELDNTFQLISVAVATGSAGASPASAVLRRGLRSGRLLTDGRQVFFETGAGISNGRRTLPCRGFCYFAASAPVLLDYLPISSDHPELGNVLLLRDSHTGRVLGRRPAVVDFAVRGRTLVLYTWQGAERESLNEM